MLEDQMLITKQTHIFHASQKQVAHTWEQLYENKLMSWS